MSDALQMGLVSLAAGGALAVLLRANWPRRGANRTSTPGCPSCAAGNPCAEPTKPQA